MSMDTCIERLQLIQCYKAIHDHFGYVVRHSIQEDSILDIFYEYADEIFDYTHRHDFGCEYEVYSTAYFYEDPLLDWIKTLVRQYGIRHHVRYQKNPVLLEMQKIVRKELGVVQDYCFGYGWDLPASSHEGKRYKLFIEVTQDFWSYVSLVTALLSLYNALKDFAHRWEKELCADTVQSSLPERRAA